MFEALICWNTVLKMYPFVDGPLAAQNVLWKCGWSSRQLLGQYVDSVVLFH